MSRGGVEGDEEARSMGPSSLGSKEVEVIKGVR